MKCRRCGEENPDESRFCHNCGAPLSPSIQDSKKGNLKTRFDNASRPVRILVIVLVVFAVLWLIGMTPHIFFGEPFDSFTEESETRNPVDFNAIDMDCDGALTYDEADGYAPEVDRYTLKDIFDEADRNHNGLLKGCEFDLYVNKIKDHNSKMEKQKKADEKNSSPSTSLPTVNLGKCPSCGSDAENMYEYTDEFGRPYYQCTVCDYWTYDEGEFYDE